MLRNAQIELEQFLGYFIEAAQITVEQPENEVWVGRDVIGNDLYELVEELELTLNLRKGHSEEEHFNFLEMMNFNYDAGVGDQVLFGTIWFKDGTWATREECNGSEWWEHHLRPEIPAELL
jgi:hypothetical protein